MEVKDQVIEFNFSEAIKYHQNIVPFMACYNQIDECVQLVDFYYQDRLRVALSYDFDFTEIEDMEKQIYVP